MTHEQQNKVSVTTKLFQKTKVYTESIEDWISTYLLGKPSDIKSILKTERRWIKQRRNKIKTRASEHNVQISDEEVARSAFGLALSGGGIRSATFNLGLLQAFERYKLLWHADYMSTVSGGGYIGSSLTWFKSITAPKKRSRKRSKGKIEDDTFPFGTQRRDHGGIGGKVLAWLRSHGYYLMPGDGLTVWSLIAAIITGTLVNLVILVPPFLLLFHLLSRNPLTLPQPLEFLNQLIAPGVNGRGFAGLFIVGGFGVLIYGIRGLIYVSTRKSANLRKYEKQDRGDQSIIIKLALSLLMVLVAVSPCLVRELPFRLHKIFSIGNMGIGFAVLLLTSLTAFFAFLVMISSYVISTIVPWLRGFIVQRRLREWAGGALMYGVLFAVVGTIPLVYFTLLRWLPNIIDEVMSAFSVSGVISILSALKGRKGGNETRGWRSLLLSIGLALLIYGIFLWFYHLMIIRSSSMELTWLMIMFFVSLLLAVLADTNQISMHRYYRNRLMEAYMPYSIEGAEWRRQPPHWYPYATHREVDRFRLKDIAVTDAPYHIINTIVQTLGSNDPKLSGRGGDSFIFSPKYCGSESTGFAPTGKYMGGDMDLATAFAISGAAVDPNTYATRSRPLSFLMTLLNIRLGYWIPNPRNPKFSSKKVRPWWWIYMFREMLGRGLTENNAQVHLSDGGHFENLGLYELVNRQCRYIIVSDATADPNFSFADLAKVIELVRVDFGAEIHINVSDIRPQGDMKYSKHAFARGKITYNSPGRNGEPEEADFLYIKTAVTSDLTEDIYGYRRAHGKFPDETTADQFFTEPQFEAYRELGFLLGSMACGNQKVRDMDSFFKNVDEYLQRTTSKNES